MRRFFIDPEGVQEGEIVDLSREESRHISRVLRLKVGTTVELLDGRGGVYPAELIEVGKTVRALVTGMALGKHADGIPLIVGQGILKGKKMDTVVQKCTELGVNRFIPLNSLRCQGKADNRQDEKRLGRYTRIVESACKQCMRPDLMVVDRPCTLSDIADFSFLPDKNLKLLFWEEEHERTLHDVVLPDGLEAVVILLGPEGGLAGEEVAVARELGFQTVSLGSRILRAETATITAASIVQYLLGNV